MTVKSRKSAADGWWLDERDLPPEVYLRAVGLIAVGISGGIVACRVAEGRAVSSSFGPRSGPGPHLVLGHGSIADPYLAALWNGSLMHCADYDDTHEESIVHPTSVVLPAALAAIGSGPFAVGDLVRGYVNGVLALVHLAGATPGRYHASGFHATAVCGPVGAAAAVLAGRREHKHRDEALGIAATMGAGTFEYINTFGNSKVVYPGIAARAGLEAVDLAAAGLRPPRAAITGRFGLIRAHTGESVDLSVDDLLDTKDASRVLFGIAVKSWPCCYFSQVFLDLAHDLRNQIGPEDEIVDILCEGPGPMLEPIMEPRAMREAPSDSYEVRFALPLQLAIMFAGFDVCLETLRPEAAEDPRVRRLASVVRYRATDELGLYPAKMPGRITVTVAGRTDQVTATREYSVGAERCTLESGAIAMRVARDLGAEGSALAATLMSPQTKLSELHTLLDEIASSQRDSLR